MFVPCPSRRQLTRTQAMCSAAAGIVSGLAGGAAGATGGPAVHTDRGCYLVGQRVGLSGAGFAAGREFDVAIDGIRTAETNFTVTRRAGGRLQASSGSPHTLRAPFEVRDFAPDGRRRTVYLHYVRPSGRSRSSVAIGKTGGQRGYLRPRSRRVFPFSPSVGKWTLQFDTSPCYQRAPGGPAARISVQIR